MSAPDPTVHPPKQERSRKTLERIVKASLEILEEEGTGGLTVQAIVARAGSSVGSFYARFGGKDDLLEYLESRVWEEAAGRWDEALASRDWSELDLAEVAEGAARLLPDAARSRATYLRGLDGALSQPGDAYADFLAHVLGGVRDLLLERRSEIAHDDPELAVRVGLQALVGVLSPAAFPSGQRPDDEVLISEAAGLLRAYLQPGSAEGPAGEVDFFDVWA